MAVLRRRTAAAYLDRAGVFSSRAAPAAFHRRAHRDRVRLVVEQRAYQYPRPGHLQGQGRQAEKRSQEVNLCCSDDTFGFGYRNRSSAQNQVPWCELSAFIEPEEHFAFYRNIPRPVLPSPNEYN